MVNLRVCFMLWDGTVEWTRGGTATKLDFGSLHVPVWGCCPCLMANVLLQLFQRI